LDDRVDPHVSGEPVRGAFDGRLLRLRFHTFLRSLSVRG
jgi:hypothetical protein